MQYEIRVIVTSRKKLNLVLEVLLETILEGLSQYGKVYGIILQKKSVEKKAGK